MDGYNVHKMQPETVRSHYKKGGPYDTNFLVRHNLDAHLSGLTSNPPAPITRRASANSLRTPKQSA